VREARGEVRLSVGWVLKETSAAVERRKKLSEIAAKCLAAPKLEDVAVDASVAIPGLTWKFAKRCGRVIVIGTTSDDEVRALARQGHAALEFIDAVFAGEAYRGSGATVYLVGTKDEARTLLSARPVGEGLADPFLAGVGGAWLRQFDTLAVCHPESSGRVDTAVRALIDAADTERFALPTRLDVVSQGLTTVVTGFVTGTRKIQAVCAAGSPDERLALSLREKGADWEKTARDMIRTGKWPTPLEAFAGEVPNAPPSAELYGHIATAFLMLGYPDRCQDVFKALGTKGTPGAAIEAVLGSDLDTFDRRMRRWLDEIAVVQGAESKKAVK
jgi:hypothetical protein